MGWGGVGLWLEWGRVRGGVKVRAKGWQGFRARVRARDGVRIGKQYKGVG